MHAGTRRVLKREQTEISPIWSLSAFSLMAETLRTHKQHA